MIIRMSESASEAARLLSQARWNTPERRRAKLQELARQRAELTPEERRELDLMEVDFR